MDKLENILPKSISQKNITRQAEAAYVCFLYKEAISVLGLESLRKISAKNIFFKNKTLTIEVSHPAHAQRIQAEGHKIKEYINQKLGKEKLERINYRIR